MDGRKPYRRHCILRQISASANANCTNFVHIFSIDRFCTDHTLGTNSTLVHDADDDAQFQPGAHADHGAHPIRIARIGWTAADRALSSATGSGVGRRSIRLALEALRPRG